MKRIVHIINEDTANADSVFKDGYEHGYNKALQEIKGYSSEYISSK